ncbi:conserved hypothetical protein [Plasmopara halstedii]|uniref:Uncharacterized protein n=1 Tax=Plasmopara halstedii TaxID=4781 RepID=A0A0P1B3P0_PLAHL|nr:conserved hypothetical protein [Plasmopara halstedii]CEG48729.1 conserved hypothetical protein [Plasmopara halstedii]|eukprot:XP_024585098.1 conserved hypothetical protein [Plasmopara halstedii]
MNLTPGYTAPSKQMQWALVLLAKLMQSLANNVEYTISTESFMLHQSNLGRKDGLKHPRMLYIQKRF